MLVALVKDTSLVLSTHTMGLTSCYNSSSRDRIFSDLSGPLYAYACTCKTKVLVFEKIVCDKKLIDPSIKTKVPIDGQY